MQPLSQQGVQPGLYQHYKGGLYQVISVATHSEDMAAMVVYRALYGNFGLWVRPASMFGQTVTLADGTNVPRFRYLPTQA